MLRDGAVAPGTCVVWLEADCPNVIGDGAAEVFLFR